MSHNCHSRITLAVLPAVNNDADLVVFQQVSLSYRLFYIFSAFAFDGFTVICLALIDKKLFVRNYYLVSGQSGS